MQFEKKSISIVIPNYNGRKLLEEYLPYTLTAIKNAGVDHEIIVVDDASTDESVGFLKTAYPQVKLLVNPQNKGFSYSCNQGINKARCELILLLNSDVKLTPDYFEHQWKYFSADDTFGVMGRIIDMEGDHIQDAARVPKLNGLKLKTDYFYYTTEPNDRLYTFYLSGANALINAEKLKSIGGFYEIFSPFYCEDMELSIRAWKLNWKCYYEHQAVCRHQMSASTKNYKTARWVKTIYYRNRFYMHAIHLNGLALLGWFLQITFIDMLPKLLIGKWWLWGSYVNLIKNRDEIKVYKKKVSTLLKTNNSHTSIFEVINKIRNAVKGKSVTRLKV
ncbi:glycosyltransferase family 2 protein [Mucilaginibacter aquariorum]|uniref:Glycosyltransferase family 2 protein n=1 Tax=Mucilaginibacter aquariorum TaxID=2967225 RepID=A0ABT1T642_9SPHI|nr:glycosyltransferase family 2 protein [Mucilaginibacter aquariorum]MCQ6959706.1 glycosyltransferase family 2 protein [Mucilaginibacter aquariorum]